MIPDKRGELPCGDWITSREAMALLRIRSLTTLAKYVGLDYFEQAWVCGRRLFSRRQIEAFLARRLHAKR